MLIYDLYNLDKGTVLGEYCSNGLLICCYIICIYRLFRHMQIKKYINYLWQNAERLRYKIRLNIVAAFINNTQFLNGTLSLCGGVPNNNK